MNRKEEHGQDVNALDVDELERVDGRDGESGRLLISVMQLVKVFVQPRRVVNPVSPICEVILESKKIRLNFIHFLQLYYVKDIRCTARVTTVQEVHCINSHKNTDGCHQ